MARGARTRHRRVRVRGSVPSATSSNRSNRRADFGVRFSGSGVRNDSRDSSKCWYSIGQVAFCGLTMFLTRQRSHRASCHMNRDSEWTPTIPASGCRCPMCRPTTRFVMPSPTCRRRLSIHSLGPFQRHSSPLNLKRQLKILPRNFNLTSRPDDQFRLAHGPYLSKTFDAFDSETPSASIASFGIAE
jgi:hypothetical protein